MQCEEVDYPRLAFRSCLARRDRRLLLYLHSTLQNLALLFWDGVVSHIHQFIMGAFTAEQVNQAFDMTCPELKSKYARYPLKYENWLNFNDHIDGQPVFIDSAQDQGLKENFVFCKNAPKGRGYYHILTKVAYVNLYSRLMSTGSGAGCSCFGGDNSLLQDAWDTTRIIVYRRSRCSKPDDDLAAEQAVDHMAGTKLNPVHGLRA